MVTIGSPWINVPVPSATWKNWSEEQRITKIVMLLLAEDAFDDRVCVISANDDGSVVVSLKQEMDAAERGTFLRRLERCLKRWIDPAITVYLQPTGDRNRLRNLRGVKVAE